MTRFLIAFTVVVGTAGVARAATSIVEHAWATPEENRQLSGLVAAEKAGHAASLQYLDRVVGEHPANATARSFRAGTLMQMGRLDEASKDLDELSRRSPERFDMADVRIYFYRIKGDRTKELGEMKSFADRKFTSDTAKRFAEISIHSYKPRMAELAGDMALAEKELQWLVDDAPLQYRADCMTGQAQFYLRKGDHAKAVAVAKAAVDFQRRRSHKGYSFANALTWLGFSLWADGKRAEALAALLEAAVQPADDFTLSWGRGSFDPAGRGLAILGARALAASRGEQEKATAAKLMDDLSRSASGMRPYSLEPVVLALTGRSETEPAMHAVATVLKQAPYSDWALWAALFLGLSDGDQAKPLLALLPKGTTQRRIAEQEATMSAGHPTGLFRD